MWTLSGTAFSNAFGEQGNFPVIDLLGQSPDALSAREVRRQIERWKTRSLARALLDAWGVESGYALERELLDAYPELGSQDEKPRLFHRMLARGEPEIAKVMQRPDSRAAVLVRKALSRAPGAAEVLSHPVWRLLDPSRIDCVEWRSLSDTVYVSSDARLSDGDERRRWRVLVISLGDQAGYEYPVPTGHPSTLDGLRGLLSALRGVGVEDLTHYYLLLLEAVECCRDRDADPRSGVLMPGCAEYLAACFGRVHVRTFNWTSLHLYLPPLQAARRALEELRGAKFSSPKPTLSIPDDF